MLHGIIDIGSSTIRMAIYDIHGKDIDMLLKKKHVVGLAAYVKDGIMTQAGIDKAVDILMEFVRFLTCFRITRVGRRTLRHGDCTVVPLDPAPGPTGEDG